MWVDLDQNFWGFYRRESEQNWRTDSFRDSGVTGWGLGFCGGCAGKNAFFCSRCFLLSLQGRETLLLWLRGRFFLAIVPGARFVFCRPLGALFYLPS